MTAEADDLGQAAVERCGIGFRLVNRTECLHVKNSPTIHDFRRRR
jgi:hypothetical protein